jgi:hypothetical protein
MASRALDVDTLLAGGSLASFHRAQAMTAGQATSRMR